jgi:hypothetical protein
VKRLVLCAALLVAACAPVYEKDMAPWESQPIVDKTPTFLTMRW